MNSLHTRRARLGSSPVEVTAFALGTAPIGNMFAPVTDEDAEAAIRAAWDLGVRYFDTAPLYGHGLSETRLGAVLRTLPRDEFVVSTKVGRLLVPRAGPGAPTIFEDTPPLEPIFDFSGDGVERSLDESLERLGLDRVDILLVHDPDDHLDEAIREALPRITRMRADGRVGAIGAGMNQTAALTRIVRETDVDCVLLAGRYTLLEQTALDDLLPQCAERGVSVIAAGVFNSGLLADPNSGATYDYQEAPAHLVARAQQLASVCAEAGSSLRSAALQFPLAQDSVACVLSGARTEAEVRENVARFSEPVAMEPWRALRDAKLIDTRAPLPGGIP